VDVQRPTAPGALGHVEDFPLLLAASGAEVVVVCGAVRGVELRSIVDSALASGCQVLAVPPELHLPGVEPAVLWRSGRPLVQLTAPTLKGWQLFLKRGGDLIGASLGLVVAGPAMLAIAALVRLDSAGPALFRQERVGSGGRRFSVLKFRTMRDGASDAAHREYMQRMQAGEEDGVLAADGRPVYKLVADDRVTRIGRWLRRTSLDELPQLLNVLRGEMSLVGPRPPLPYEFEAYDHWQFDRLQVKPGITGLWQVSGRNLLTYRQMCELDVEYVRRWSLLFDLQILVKTIPVVFFNSGRAH
jgi:exopolysaccharide biosynthesis polyprenyl glycosylphosphotransferase